MLSFIEAAISMQELELQSSSSTVNQGHAELLYLIEQFLALGPCKDAAKVLRQEIDQHKLLPKRVDFAGHFHQRHFSEYEQLHRKLVPQDFILKLWQQVRPILVSQIPRPGQFLVSFDRQLLLRTKGTAHSRWSIEAFVARRNQELLLPPSLLKKKPHLSRMLAGRELGGHSLNKALVFENFTPRIELYNRILGHLSSVFCVAFDRLGQYVFTGADDNLIKVWSATTAQLLFTFRGFQGEVSDLTISHENTLLAAASCDKTIRIWNLRTGAPVATLQGHSAVVTSLQFLPYVNGDVRYLVSTGNDCCVCFWKWDASTNIFDTIPIKYAERLRVGGQMICSSHSSGGLFIATGGTDRYVRVYTLKNGYPERILEVEGHTEHVDSLQWAHRGLKFITGSKDGMAKIWTFERTEWKTRLLSISSSEQKASSSESSAHLSVAAKAQRLKITMVAWSLDDSLVITGMSDKLLRVWDAQSGLLLRTLVGHMDEAYGLEPHPIHSSLFLSAGHDGNLIIWNLHTGEIVKKHFNSLENVGHAAFFDCRFSPDGQTVAAVDSHGHLTLLGLASNETIKEAPREQFFHTDYRPLLRDANNYVIDEQTQIAPHLMPPPFLVNSDGDPYAPCFQRRVPGRERCSDEFLLPYYDNVRQGDRDTLTGVVNALPNGNDPFAANITEEQVCTWANRPLVRGFPSAVYRCNIDLRQALKHEEAMIYEHELNRPPIVPQEAAITTEDSSQMAGIALRPRRPPLRGRIDERPPERVAAPEIEPVPPAETNHVSEQSDSASNYSTDDEDDDSGSSESVSYSDPEYSETSVPRTRLRARKDSDDENSRASIQESPTLAKQRKRSPVISVGETASEEPGPSHINGNSHRPKRRRVRMLSEDEETAPTGDVVEKPRKTKPKRVSRVILEDEPQTLSDIPKQFVFPEWITSTMPRKAPFFPQIGDEIVYFPAGHRLYIEEVQRLQEYAVTEKNLPWNRIQLQAEEFAIIDGVRFDLEPVRLCCLRLLQIDPKTNIPTKRKYVVRYHDMPAVVDFFVLRQHYEKSIRHRWKPGDHFQAVIDDKWWFGTIKAREATKGHFQSLHVVWDTGEEEKMSPWDLEPVDSAKCRSKRPTSVSASQAELLRLGSYEPKLDEWPQHGMDAEVRRLLKGIDRIMEFGLAEPFVAPVDLNAYPNYVLQIEYPSDLSTIRERLENRFYRRQRAFRFDVVQIGKNASRFNERHSDIVRKGRTLVAILLKYIEDPSCENIAAIHNEVTSSSSVVLNPRNSTEIALEDGSADESSKARRLRRRKMIKKYPEIHERRDRPSSRQVKRPQYRDSTDDEDRDSGVIVSTSMRGRVRKVRKFL